MKCYTCKIAQEIPDMACCVWYMDNVVCGDKTTKDCTEYIPCEKRERRCEGMTIYEFAEGLNGRQYGKELYPFEEQRAKELGFVVVFGYSDDNTEFRGAYDEEIGCFDGGRVYEDGDKYIDAVWCEGEYSWTYKTNIPHATFDIYDEAEKYCRGIVFEKVGEQK